MNDETFVSLVQRGAGLTDIRSGTWLKKQTNLKVKRVIRLISRLWQRWIVSPSPPLFCAPTAAQKSPRAFVVNNLYLYLLALFNERGVLNVANTIDKFHGGGEDLRIVGQLVRTLGKLENQGGICKLEGHLLPTRYTNCVVSQVYRVHSREDKTNCNINSFQIACNIRFNQHISHIRIRALGIRI